MANFPAISVGNVLSSQVLKWWVNLLSLVHVSHVNQHLTKKVLAHAWYAHGPGSNPQACRNKKIALPNIMGHTVIPTLSGRSSRIDSAGLFGLRGGQPRLQSKSEQSVCTL